jgi:predicted CXXCH cytochrome family protein
VSVALVGGLAVCVAAWSCSVQSNYQTLSFFFDGVPDPNAPMPAGKGGAAVAQSPTYSVHQPYKEEKCAACHTGSGQLTGRDSSVCLTCHAGKVDEHRNMHGPVSAGACLWCHSPHESPELHLLKKPGREVCTQCHEAAALPTARTPAHAETARNCLECHTGHGSEGRNLLRGGAPAAGGTPVPEREKAGAPR